MATVDMPYIPVPGDNPMGDAMTAITGGPRQAGGVRIPAPQSGFVPGVFDEDEDQR
jgi:hypothetical protein